MIGKAKLVSVSYRQFTRRVRKLMPSAKPKEIYVEWCRELEKLGAINYDECAMRILDRRLTSRSRRVITRG